MRFLGIDFGDVRIGLAVSDSSGTIARPLRTITPSGSLDEYVVIIAREVTALASEVDGLDVLVVGVPRSLDGTPHQQTTRTLAFVESLRKATALPVVTQDERLTSVEAEQRLRQMLLARLQQHKRRSATSTQPDIDLKYISNCVCAAAWRHTYSASHNCVDGQRRKGNFSKSYILHLEVKVSPPPSQTSEQHESWFCLFFQ